MIAAGLGFRASCGRSELLLALERALAGAALELGDVQLLCSLEIKVARELLIQTAEHLHKPLCWLSHADLAAHAALALTSSERVLERFGLPSIAETAALAGAFALGGKRGPARLLGPRQLSGAASCALASVEAAP